MGLKHCHILCLYRNIPQNRVAMAKDYNTEILTDSDNAAAGWYRRHFRIRGHHTPPERPSIRIGASSRRTSLSKYLPILGLVMTTAMSSVLLSNISQPAYINDSLYHFIEMNRPSAQAILHILATTLGFLDVYALTSAFNLTTRSKLTKQATSLDRLTYWSAISHRTGSLKLPWEYLALALIFSVTTPIPATFWTSALTPTLSNHQINMTVTIPRYASDPQQEYWNTSWYSRPFDPPPHPVWRHQLGTFSYTPAYDRGESMISTAAEHLFDYSNSTKGIPRSDKTGFTYSNRSRGIGASVGLVEPISGLKHNHVFAYNYTEIGYDTDVSCIFNSSSQWVVEPYQPDKAPCGPALYLCQGSTPDNAKDWYPQYTAAMGEQIVCMNGHAEHISPGGKGIVTIAAGWGSYAPLNGTQCKVTFKPTLFQVDVDLKSYSINVTALGSAIDIDPTANENVTFDAWNCNKLDASIDDLSKLDCGLYTAQGQPGLGIIATSALRQLNDLSMMDNSLYYSNIGEMFLSNTIYKTLHGSEISYDISNSEANPLNQSLYYDALISSIETVIASLLDDSLLAFSSSQIILQNSTTLQPGNMTVGAVRFGTKGYTYAIFAVNAVIFVIYLEEMLRTSGWKHLSKFDYTDIKSVVIASSLGGSGIADTVVAKHKEKETSWDADGRDRAAGAILVHLEARGNQGSVQLVQTNDGGNLGSGAIDDPEKYVDSPPQNSVVWKGSRYTKLESAGAYPLI